MDFSTLESKYGFFYAPAFQVLVNDKDLLMENVEIFNVSIDLVIHAAGTFSFTVNNPYNPDGDNFPYLAQDGLFALGSEVVVKMGYGDRSRLATLFIGYITGHDITFPANGLSQLTVKGFDRLHHMMKDQHSENWGSVDEPVSYSDVVEEIVRKNSYQVKTTGVRKLNEKHRQLKQDRQNDFDFIKQLADMIGFEVFVRTDELFFREPANESTEAITKLRWGESLFTASPRVSTADVISAVEVRGWDPAEQKAIVGTASSGDESGLEAGAESGADAVASTQGEQVKHLWKPVSTEKQATDLAKSIFDRAAMGFVEANGDCIGLPDLIPGFNVELDGLGSTFNKKYYVTKTTHAISTSGYKTSFAAKETSL